MINKDENFDYGNPWQWSRDFTVLLMMVLSIIGLLMIGLLILGWLILGLTTVLSFPVL